jgi:hypothetical protein
MSNFSTPQSATAVATNVSTETAILTIPFSSGATANALLGIPVASAAGKNVVLGSMNITAGTGTTAVVVKCRQGAGTVAGTQVGPSKTVTLAATATAEIPLAFQDTAPNSAEAYTITVTQTGGTAAGTVNAITAYTSDYS